MNTTGIILPHSVLIEQVKSRTIKILEKNQDRLIYNNLGRLIRMEKYLNTIQQYDGFENDVFENAQLAIYLIAMIEAESKLTKIDFEAYSIWVDHYLEKLTQEIPFTEEQVDHQKKIIIASQPNNKNELLESKLISDIYMMDFTDTEGKRRIKAMYEEMILKGFKLPPKSWYETVTSLMSSVKAETNYGKKFLQPKFDALTKKLNKEYKLLEEKENRLLKKELDINEAEIKQLKKEMTKVKSRDDKGIQTLFRLTVKNHYTLNEMIDRKANIMITVNSIIISLVVGGIIGKSDTMSAISLIPVTLLIVTSIGSIILAILSIRPNITQGNFTEEEIRQKKHNLLYFGNFHNMGFPDFEWAFLQMLGDRDYLYSAMIKDYYFLGVMLSKKYRLLRTSLTIFLYGLLISTATFLVVRFAWPAVL